MRNDHMAYWNGGSGLHHALSLEAQTEFEALSDYIWKVPRFLETEEQNERKKLDAYFPPDDKSDRNQRLRSMRAGMEFKKIWVDFPVFQRTSNLLMVVSVFEYHLVRLVEAESSAGIQRKSLRGVSDAMEYIAHAAPSFKQDECYAAVDGAIKIRNRLVHSGGKLGSTPRCNEIRKIVSEMTYASLSHQAHWAAKFPDLKPVRIWNSDRGDWVRLEENYAHIASGYCRDLYVAAGIALDPNWPA